MKKPNEKALESIKASINSFEKIIRKSKEMKTNETDTRVIINDILEKVLGYDKYFDVTSEYMIKGTYADYVIKSKGKKYIVIEAKSIDTDLKPDHVRQTINYAANEGILWAILTNGIEWQIYKVTVDKQVDKKLFFEVNLLNLCADDIINLFYISKTAVDNNLLEEYWNYRSAFDPSLIVKILLSDEIINKIRKEVQNAIDYKITSDEITNILISKVLRSEVIKELTSESNSKEFNQVKIDLDGITPVQKEILKILLSVSEPITSNEIKNKLPPEILETISSLGGPMSGISKRLGKALIKTDTGYKLEKKAQKIIDNFLINHQEMQYS